MLLHRIGKPVLSLIVFKERDSLFETPIVDEPCDSRMLVKRRPLAVVGVEFIPVGFMDQHMSQKVVLVEQFKLIQILTLHSTTPSQIV